MHPRDKLVRPTPPLFSPQRKVVVLEQEDAHAVAAMKVIHLLDDFVRLAHANYLAGRRTVERVDRAE